MEGQLSNVIVTKSEMAAMNSCPDCGAMGTLQFEGGCAICRLCGWSPCK